MINPDEHPFVVCLRNDGYLVSLRVGKLYHLLPDELAAQHDYIRVIDESGEDYLFPESYFAPVDLPAAARDALLQLQAA